jgi:tRNA threonylcarbamoyladenosine biosynthesis protein TsaE
VIHSSAPEETRAAGDTLGRVLVRRGGAGAVVALVGPLGTGKTCFVQGLARGLGVSGYVRSPTFILVHEYQGPVPLYHVDLYRVARSDLEGLGLEEILDGEGVTAIEWADHAESVLPSEHLRVEFAFGEGESDRLLRLGARGDRYLGILEDVAACASSR